MPEPKEQQHIADSFISHLRNAARIQCPICNQAFPGVDERIRGHLEAAHPEYIEGKDIAALIRDVKRGRVPAASATRAVAGPTRESPSVGKGQGGGARAMEASGHHDKRRKSPPGFSAKLTRPRSTSPTSKRSRARGQLGTQDPDFLRRDTQPGKLWSPEDGASPSSAVRSRQPARPSRSSAQSKKTDVPEDPEEAHRIIREPETTPIRQEQLVAEVKGIYAGLMMVETKCIEVDNAQQSQSESKLNDEQWQALIALHRTLLHEHHDFFLASQHPTASPALKRLASKYAMPARMWRHGIHSFLELLRHRLPASLEHMLTFIYLAYSMMALLYETVPAFEDTWIECLGDLGRYRMAIEDEDIRDRETWTAVSQHWYSKASDKAPTTGRLYHHLAILARPNVIQQLFYYTKSLCVPAPFSSARESIMTLFDPVLRAPSAENTRVSPTDFSFVKAHGVLFSKKNPELYHPSVTDFLDTLDYHIAQITKRWVEAGYQIGIANCCALLSYGNEQNVIMRSFYEHERDHDMEDDAVDGQPPDGFDDVLRLVMGTHEVVFRRWHDPNVLAYAHVVMVFMHSLLQSPSAMRCLEQRFPWKLLSLMLNTFLLSCQQYSLIQSDKFPTESSVEQCPLPEDFALKGFYFVESYHPKDLFSKMKIADDEKYLEKPSLKLIRKQRILWLAHKIAQTGSWLTWDGNTKRFGVNPRFEMEIDLSKEVHMMDMSDATETEPETQASAGGGEAMDIDDASGAC